MVALVAPALLGLLLGELSDRTWATAILLLAEPLLLAAAFHLLGLALLARRWATAGALAVGVGVALLAVRLPPPLDPPHKVRPAWTVPLRGCALVASPVNAPVRLLTWSLTAGEPERANPNQVLSAQPDLVVLTGVDGPELGRAIGTGLGGESKYFPGEGPGEGLSLVARGSFQYCGNQVDQWTVTLPAASGRTARLVVGFPKVVGKGVVPLLAVQLDRPGSPSQWPQWAERLDEGTRILAALVDAIGPERLVVTVDFEAPSTFRQLAGRLAGSRLVKVPVPA